MNKLLAGMRFKVGSTPRSGTLRILEPFAAVLLTLSALILVFEDTLTKTSLRLARDGAGTTFVPYTYDDASNGGTSRVTLDKRNPLHWSCQLTIRYQYGYCGFGLQFDWKQQGRGLDLSKYESVKLRLSYRGPARFVRLSVKNLDAKYISEGAKTAEKVSQGSLDVSKGVREVRLNLADLTVAEWWRESAAAGSELSRPEFSNVVALEVLTGADSKAGLHQLAIEEVVLEGRLMSSNTLHRSTIACWILLISILLWRRKESTRRLREEFARSLQKTLNTIPQMVWSLDEHGQLNCNDRWYEFTGMPKGEPATEPMDLVHPDDRELVSESWRVSAATGERLEMEYRQKHHSDGHRWVLTQAVPARNDAGAVTGWYGTCTDIDDRVRAQRELVESVTREQRKSEELRWWSDHDVLTSLPNRRAFQARLEEACPATRRKAPSAGLLLIDLDHFKHVNDSLGHAAGDEYLRAIGERLRVSVRETDFVARLGGDEFAVLMHDMRSDEDLRQAARALSIEISKPLRLGKHVLSPGASIGAALWPRHASTTSNLSKAADAALYALKRAGRGGVKIFQPEMLMWLDAAASQLRIARSALDGGKLSAVYQPKVDVQTGALVGYEALLRWHDPANGLQLPETIEEAFKDYELSARIGEQMQRRVARDMRQWITQAIPFGRVSINAAPAEFLRDDYAERLLALLAEEKIAPDLIEVEVTEYALLERGPDYVARALSVLKDAGVRIALDDFGTGYSSLAHLRDFPVDVLKIDKSFVQQMTDDEEIAAIVAGVINLAHTLKIEVVAEGVETSAQLELLRCIGCHTAQGYLLGSPMLAAEAVRAKAAA